MKKYVTPGVVLVLAGVYFLLDALPGINIPSGCLLLFVGAGLLVGRLCTQKYGLSIAGFIVFCLGAGFFARDILKLNGGANLYIVPLSLALAFFLIHICEFRRIGNWPIFPALILLLTGLMMLVTMVPSINAILRPYYGAILPAILIIIGISLLIRGAVQSNRRRTQPRVTYTQAQAQPNVPPQDTATWAQPPVQPEAPNAAEAPQPEVTNTVPQDAAYAQSDSTTNNEEQGQ